MGSLDLLINPQVVVVFSFGFRWQFSGIFTHDPSWYHRFRVVCQLLGTTLGRGGQWGGAGSGVGGVGWVLAHEMAKPQGEFVGPFSLPFPDLGLSQRGSSFQMAGFAFPEIKLAQMFGGNPEHNRPTLCDVFGPAKNEESQPVREQGLCRHAFSLCKVSLSSGSRVLLFAAGVDLNPGWFISQKGEPLGLSVS